MRPSFDDKTWINKEIILVLKSSSHANDDDGGWSASIWPKRSMISTGSYKFTSWGDTIKADWSLTHRHHGRFKQVQSTNIGSRDWSASNTLWEDKLDMNDQWLRRDVTDSFCWVSKAVKWTKCGGLILTVCHDKHEQEVQHVWFGSYSSDVNGTSSVGT